jgi:hypothetical protein
VLVSRLGRALRARQLRVGDLQRRLHQRGHAVSRGALDRLMSNRPVKTVDLDILIPVLDELGVPFEAAFTRIPSDTLVEQAAARPGARETARWAARAGRSNVAAADAELAAVADRLEENLRTSHPDLFDKRGRLRQRALERLLLERFGGKSIISGDQLHDLLDHARAHGPHSLGAT